MTTLTEDCRTLKQLKAEEDEAKAVYDDVKASRERFESELIERMRAEEADGHKTDGSNFVPARTVYGQIQDRSEFVAWAKENDDVLLETKERKALINELVRERQDNGEPLPPGVGFYVREYVSIRGA